MKGQQFKKIADTFGF